MPIPEVLKRRDVLAFIIGIVLVAILVISQIGPFIAYGVPSITFHTATETQPEVHTVSILNSFGSWTAYDYSHSASEHWGGVTWSCELDATLHVTLSVKVEVTDLALSGYLTDITPPPFLIQNTSTTLYYKNITMSAYGYGFKVTLSWTGTASVTENNFIFNGWTYTGLNNPQYGMQQLLPQMISDFNNNCYVASKLLMSIDAPTLATDQAYALRPDYIGILGMWLIDYKTVGYTSGTATEALPASVGTAVQLYRDSSLTVPAWSPSYSTANTSQPLLTPTIAYWLDHYAVPSAWFQTSIIHLGSQLLYNASKPYPNYTSWAWENGNAQAPAIAQWFRVDLAFRTTTGWTAPNIPQYQLPADVQSKMKIIITTEPQNQGVPLSAPSVPNNYLEGLLWELLWIVVIIIIVVVVAFVVVKVLKKRRVI